MPIAVTSHVGRDLLQNAAYFNSAPKVVMEYVSNSIDNAPDGQVVRVDVTISNSEIIIADNASGMSQTDLMHFFTMHGVNRQRKRGRKVRGRFGTGKSAAFGIADGLRVDTVKDGRRNVLELHRDNVLNVPDGSAIPVEHVVVDKKTSDSNGTTVIVYDLQLDKIFITPVRERLERALGRHLDMHEVYINGRRLRYRRPDSVGTFTFDVPDELLAIMPNTKPMQISVAREALTSVENGIALLSNGFLNAMTLGAASGKPYTERIFGEVEVPDLDDERDDEHFPAFDNTRDLSLNQQNPRAKMVLDWLSANVEEVRHELDVEAQLARLSEVNIQMQDAADFVGELINSDFDRVQRRLRVATQNAIESNTIESSEVVEVQVERPVREELPKEEAPAMDEFQAEVESYEGEEPQPEAEQNYLPIDYDEPDEPDAVPVEFQAPAQPELIKEETSPEAAFDAYMEYAAELDYLEEKAYQETMLEQARMAATPEERRQVVQQALLGKEAQGDEHEDFVPPVVRPAQNFQDTDTQDRYGENYPTYDASENTITETHQQHVMSNHRVLVTRNANQLQSEGATTEDGSYEERWVVDRDSFIAGRNPQEAPTVQPSNGNGNGNGNDKDAEQKKYKKPRRRTYFHIQFEHMGEEAPRSRFAEEGRTIYINRDHPQIAHIEATEGVESLAYKNLMNEIVIQEYASAVVKQMASTGFYVADPFDAIETIQAVVNRLALEAGVRMKSEGEELEAALANGSKPVVTDDDDDFDN